MADYAQQSREGQAGKPTLLRPVEIDYYHDLSGIAAEAGEI